MDVQEFAKYHLPALETDEARYTMQIAVLSAALAGSLDLEYWTLGGPGHCATRLPGYGILLGALDHAECKALARRTKDIDYTGVIGCDDKALWFAGTACDLGITFANTLQQRIHVLQDAPRSPSSEGLAHIVTLDNALVLFEWLICFYREVIPYEPVPHLDDVAKAAVSGRFLFWTVAGEPVSMAAIGRRHKTTATINAVYTPPEKRGRGYAACVTATAAARAFAEGSTTVCLHADVANPASNRCYAKIGFKPYCNSWCCLRSTSRRLEH